MKQVVFIFCILFCSTISVFAHGGFIQHGEDIMAVLGLQNNARLFNRSKDTKNNHSWVKFISSDMIDNVEFHKLLEQKHHGFNVSGARSHRLLFHWAYETEPWNAELERRIKDYCDTYDLNIESNLRVFKSEILAEQKRRNKLIIRETQKVFGFENGGIQGCVYAHFFASMAYNIHLLGDYTSDNTVLEGLFAFDKLVGKIVVELRNLDFASSKQLIKGITRIYNQKIDVQQKADILMAYLKQEVPNFIKSAKNGSIRRKIEGQGYIFIQ